MLEYSGIFQSEFSFKTLFLTYLPKVQRSQLLRGREKKIKTKSFCGKQCSWSNMILGLCAFKMLCRLSDFLQKPLEHCNRK